MALAVGGIGTKGLGSRYWLGGADPMIAISVGCGSVVGINLNLEIRFRRQEHKNTPHRQPYRINEYTKVATVINPAIASIALTANVRAVCSAESYGLLIFNWTMSKGNEALGPSYLKISSKIGEISLAVLPNHTSLLPMSGNWIKSTFFERAGERCM